MDFRFSVRTEDGRRLGVTAWRLGAPALMIASAPLGGGLGLRRWVLNAEVQISYDRMDPAAHLAGLATAAGLDGPGVGLLTAVDVRELQRTHDGGVQVAATVGLAQPVWAAAASEEESLDLEAGRCGASTGAPDLAPLDIGTVNIVAWVPVRLSDAAMVNAVATATEAKTQALVEAGVDGTGTASDAVCVACPPEGDAEAFGGPRSRCGARLARAVHAAVAAGAAPGGSDTSGNGRC